MCRCVEISNLSAYGLFIFYVTHTQVKREENSAAAIEEKKNGMRYVLKSTHITTFSFPKKITMQAKLRHKKINRYDELL